MIGTQVSHYAIEAEIGRGGMGVVYRARDVRLDRTVALKFLPSHVGHDRAAVERFTREAKTAAQTEHPNVCGVHDIGETGDGRRFIAMPFYEGEDLSDRTADEPMPVGEAMAVARQVASGLARVHVHGIVHRDIKPGNIFVTTDGTVKILDFGLARTDDQQTVTETGSAVGTFAYMSPEQVRGEKLDPRTDIWSVGAVLYELLTGKRPFSGDYPQACMYSVLNEDPEPLSSILPDIPVGVSTVVERCLEKDRSTRYQSAVELENDLALIEQDLLPASRSRRSLIGARPRPIYLVALVAAVAVAAIVAASTALFRGVETEAVAPVRLPVLLPEGNELAFPGPSLAISPDGDRVAFAAGDSASSRIFVREMDSFDARPLEGTENGRAPFFSPDGNWLGFLSNGKLNKVRLDGGQPIELAAAPVYISVVTGAAKWLENGDIVFSSTAGDGSLFTVSSQGGPLERLTEVESAARENHLYPEIIPSSSYMLFSKVVNLLKSSIVALSLEDGSTRTLVSNATNPKFVAPDILVYGVEADLYAVRIDPKRAELISQPVPVINGVKSGEGGYVEFDMSENGAIAYASQGTDQFQTVTNVVSLSGSLEPLAIEMTDLFIPRASRDGRYLAFQRRNSSGYSLWLHDLTRNVTRRLSDPNYQAFWYAWTPDSRRILFNSPRGGKTYASFDIYDIPVDGSDEARLVSDGRWGEVPQDVTPDGSVLVYAIGVDDVQLDIVARRLDGDGDGFVQTLVASEKDDFHPAVSPDGRWLAFASARSEQWEVYLQPFPGPGAVQQVSSGGGAEPLWSADGKTLFYRTPNGRSMMAVDVSQPPIQTVERSIGLGRPKLLFEGPFYACSKWGRSYDVMADGEHFVISTVDWPGAERTRFNVVLNWTTEVRARLDEAG